MKRSLDTVMLAIVCALVVFAPLARGSVHMWAVSLIQTGVLLCLVLAVLDRVIHDTPLVPATPLALPLLVLALLAAVSAVRSAHPALALEGVLFLLTCMAVFFIVRRLAADRGHQRILVYTIIGTAVFLAVFGLFKRFGVNPFFFWQYDELRYSPLFLSATYGNHNHLAGFIEMALPFALILFLIRTRSHAFVFTLVYLVFVLLTVQALTLSRGGWAATIVSLCFMGAVLVFQRRFHSKKLVLGLALAALASTAVILASTPLVDRVMTLTHQDPAASVESRMIAWAGTLDMIQAHAATGTGPGTFAAAFPRFQPPGLGVYYHHAHNDYLEFLSDLGIGVIPVLIWLAGVFFFQGFKNQTAFSRQTRGVSLACMTAVVAVMVHGTGDFNMRIPANALVFSVIAGLMDVPAA